MKKTTQDFMERAIELAREGPISDNPRVGAVIVRDHRVVGEGFHRGAGTPHAEVEAITQAGELTQGAQMFVSLEPCAHHGRTGPCTEAIIAAGISKVTYAQSDPTINAAGGAKLLSQAGVHVTGGMNLPEAERLNRAWTHWVLTGSPFVTWKFAQSIDAKVADRIGARTAISGPLTQAAIHQLRSEADAIVVGTRTVWIDDPQLTARNPQGDLLPQQPLRVIVGESDLPTSAALFTGPGGEVLHLRTRDIPLVINQLSDRGVRHILVEGGPTLAGAFLSARAVHQVITIVGPMTFGAGPSALNALLDPHYSISNIHWEKLDHDLVISGTPVSR
jgi:diaminohydroxyphosphoribosylaminopyrimidine deaminase/5-amino-6-(5-phosphoribosylamino)uracil reductase